MSLAWQDPIVLWREPWSAVARRLSGRAVGPVVMFVLAGVPGSAWAGVVPWLWLRVVMWVIGGLGLVLWLLAVGNLARTRRARLVRMPTGAIERPLSIQEKLLGSRPEYVIGADVTVTVAAPDLYGRAAEPRVTLAADGEISRMPLYGADVAAWVDDMNAALDGAAVLRLVEADATVDSEED